MSKLVMAITYQPKIEPVKDGRCKQTIRMGGKVSINDEILFHGWAGKPYKSKWDWRKRVVVTNVESIYISESVICFYVSNKKDFVGKSWDSFWAGSLAIQDFIDPPTGEALRDVLFKLNGAPAEPEEYQIISW